MTNKVLHIVRKNYTYDIQFDAELNKFFIRCSFLKKEWGIIKVFNFPILPGRVWRPSYVFFDSSNNDWYIADHSDPKLLTVRRKLNMKTHGSTLLNLQSLIIEYSTTMLCASIAEKPPIH